MSKLKIFIVYIILLVSYSCSNDNVIPNNDIPINDFDTSSLSIERITLSTPLLHFDFIDSLNGIGIGIYGNYIYRTYDGGFNWELINNSYENLQRVHFFDKDNILISGRKSIEDGNEFFVLISSNAGATFKEIMINSIKSEIFSISVFKDGTAFMTTHDGIRRSIDFGNSWETIPNLNIFITKIIKKSDSVLYCGSDNGIILMSTNNGDDWTQINTSFNHYIYIKQIVNDKIYFVTNGTLYSTEDFNEFTNHNRYFNNDGNYLHVMNDGKMVYFGSQYSEIGGFVPTGIICLTSNNGLSWNDYYFGISDEWMGFANGIRISEQKIIIKAIEGYEDSQLLHIVIK